MMLQPHLKEVELEQGVFLQEQGEVIERVYFPNSGMISLLAVMQQGNSVETATIGREGAVGAMAGLGPRHAFTRAVVQMPGTASQIVTSKFQAVVAASPEIRDIIVRHNEVLLAQVQQSAACNALHEAEFASAAGYCNRAIAPTETWYRSRRNSSRRCSAYAGRRSHWSRNRCRTRVSSAIAADASKFSTATCSSSARANATGSYGGRSNSTYRRRSGSHQLGLGFFGSASPPRQSSFSASTR